MNITKLISGLLGAVLIFAGVFLGGVWVFCRAYVPPDKMLVLVRKTGQALPPGQIIAEDGQKGIQRVALGPGRYFYNPLVWDWELHDLFEVPAGDPTTWSEHYTADAVAGRQPPTLKGNWPQVGVVTSLAGKPWEKEIEVVDEGYQGIQREVLTPGTYRLNPRAFKVELKPAVVVPLGHCGVVTSLLGDVPETETVAETLIGPDGRPIEGEQKRVLKLAQPGQRGVLQDILPPGIYYLNPYIYKVTIVQVGYNELSQPELEAMQDVIRFPARDGFTIQVEVTVVWGRHPEHAPEMIARFGDVEKLQQIVLGQIRSICRNLGSEYDSTDFIRGEKREQYQISVTETLRRVAEQRDIEILIALIQNIDVRGGSQTAGGQLDLRATIQRGYIAKEEELTRNKERETARVKAELETAKAQIEVAREQIASDTRKKVAELLADGAKQAAEIDAQRDLEVARLERQIAELDAAKTRTLGTAGAKVQELANRAEADGKRMMVAAFGSGQAYNLYTFAESFDPESIRLIYAGEGTFWTDLSRLQDAAAMEVLKGGAEKSGQK